MKKTLGHLAATDPYGNTSEFFACQEVTDPAQDYDWHYEYDPLYRLTYACMIRLKGGQNRGECRSSH